MAACIEYNENKAYSAAGKANIFNSFFQSVFNKFSPDDALDPNAVPVTDSVISDLSCSPGDVTSVLRQLDPTKACGPDGISSRILKNCAHELAPSLTKLFNHSLTLGSLPSDWKQANVVPIFNGNQTLADNYRPVSLTSIVVTHNHIMAFLQELKLLSDNQHRFLPSRSCLTQLLQLVHNWFSALDSGTVDAFF